MTHDQEVAYETLGVEPAGAGMVLNPAIDGYVLTADRNIIHTRATVLYHIEDPLTAIFNFAGGANQQFNLAGVSNAVQNAANNALVASAARFNVDDILIRDVAGFQDAVRHRLDDLVEREQLGVAIDQCQVQSEPPRPLADVFRQVTAARENRDKLIQDAFGLQNRTLSEAGALAVAITNSAAAARTRYVTSVQSDAEAFSKLLPQYQLDPQLYARSELVKAMTQIFTNVEKMYLPDRADGQSRQLRLQINREPPQSRTAANP
jgi:membrane protease subunit HflK